MEDRGEFSHNPLMNWLAQQCARLSRLRLSSRGSRLLLRMLLRMLSRLLPRLLSHAVLYAALLAANTSMTGRAIADSAVDADTHTVRLALTTEPPDLDSLTSTDSVSFFILLHTQEGLLTYTTDAQGNNDALTGGVAESWQMDGTTVRFTLRDNARWCDGKPVTARDFLFAWQTALNPSTASRYAFILYPLKNAEKIHRGQLPASALGVFVEDDRHLRIELEQPTAYFASLTTFPTYFPVREDFYRAQQGRYGADADKLLCNGAFRLTEWTHGASLTLQRNPGYWHANSVSLQAIHIPHITNDPNTLFNLFQSGDIALAELSQDTVRLALQQRLYIQDFGNGMLTYLEFNHREGKALRNQHLRRAISLVINRQELVNKVIAAPGTHATTRFFPAWLAAIADNNLSPASGADIVAARHALQQAKQELGVDKIPPLVMLVYDSPSVIRQAEYLQRVLQENLGVTMIIDKQIFKQKLAKLAAGDFDLSLSAWGPDYNDPMTFADLLGSANENNHGQYRNPAYDALLQQAAALPAGAERNTLFGRLQQIIDEDVAVIPLTEPGIVYVQDKSLQDVRRHRFGGDPDLRFTRIVPDAGKTP
ncbi:MAG TPA: peptide ABC transporter substrate-binding protein [Pseudomonadales bacterium]|nr:peptide ABC transporter substrate-binding protein [Pseudomonadales bacterium]